MILQNWHGKDWQTRLTEKKLMNIKDNLEQKVQITLNQSQTELAKVMREIDIWEVVESKN